MKLLSKTTTKTQNHHIRPGKNGLSHNYNFTGGMVTSNNICYTVNISFVKILFGTTECFTKS